MKLTKRREGGVTILDVKGKITIGEGDVKLREAIESELAAGPPKLLVNLRRAPRMDSSGMAELVAGFNKVREAGGELKLVNLPARIRNVLGVTQLTTVFEIFDDEAAALASFTADA